jgi:hypothetical protein
MCANPGVRFLEVTDILLGVRTGMRLAASEMIKIRLNVIFNLALRRDGPGDLSNVIPCGEGTENHEGILQQILLCWVWRAGDTTHLDISNIMFLYHIEWKERIFMPGSVCKPTVLRDEGSEILSMQITSILA